MLSILHRLEERQEEVHGHEGIRCALQSLQEAIAVTGRSDEIRLANRIQELLADQRDGVLIPGEAWSDRALDAISKLDAKSRRAWRNFILHMGTAGAKPSKKWSGAAMSLVEAVGRSEFMACMLDWMPLVDKPRTESVERTFQGEPDPNLRLCEFHMDVLRGFCALMARLSDPRAGRVLRDLATSTYRKIPGLGPRATRVGNAAVQALGHMATMDAVGHLAILRVKVKFGMAQKEIDKAMSAAARSLNVGREDLEESCVPTYGLSKDGRAVTMLGEARAELAISGSTQVTLSFFGKDGKRRASIPASARRDHPEAIAALKATSKDLQKMLPAQRERIDQLYLQRKSWPLATWRARYCEHPLIGFLARRLIWSFSGNGKETAAVCIERDGRDELIDSAGRACDIGNDVTVSLWHPIGRPFEETASWRNFFEKREIRQPFKQAHREVYVLTDAERATATYSNRFASHFLRQHQFNALCGVRNWRNTLRLMVDDEFPPASRALPAWGLRAEFWIEGVGDAHGTDTNDAGVFLYVATDQVRFYPIDSSELTAHAGGGAYGPQRGQQEPAPIALDQIPPLVFSEIMRDADLFVGVTSVGNNPAWNDGGPRGHFQGYWHDYSFGDLSATAEVRRELLTRLIPRLRLAETCSVTDRFLVVKGKLRTYKIHLGSGNILMEPGDQYLCIVPASGSDARVEHGVFLPFEGDRTLSIILSKAFLLAEDHKITDQTIVRQIKFRA